MTIKPTIPHLVWILLVWMIIGSGMALRIHNGDYFPIYQNDDSPFYVWLGNSIWDDFSRPSSLTIFEDENETLFWRSQYRDLDPVNRFGFRLTEKFFDHPFLMSLLIALPARYFGYTGFSQIPQMIVRIPAFLSALATLFLTYLVAARFFNKYVGLMATAILSFWPLAVFAQRQGYLENMITPWLLLLLLGLWEVRQKIDRRWMVVIVLAGFFAGWTKFVGYTLLGVAIYWFIQQKRYRQALTVTGFSLASLGLYFLYGYFVGGPHFWWSIAQQGSRGSYLTSVITYFSSSQIQGSIQDGWWYLGLLGLIVLAFHKNYAGRLLGMTAFFWFLATFLLAGPENTSPWYIYPVYPIMAIGSAWTLYTAMEENGILADILLILLGMAGWHLAGVEVSSWLIRLAVASVLGLRLSSYFSPKKFSVPTGRLVVMGLLLTAFLGNVIAVRRIPQRVCGDGGCVYPDKIQLLE